MGGWAGGPVQVVGGRVGGRADPHSGEFVGPALGRGERHGVGARGPCFNAAMGIQLR